VTCEQVAHGLHAALVGHERHLQTGSGNQNARRDRRDGLHADPGIGQLARARFRIVDKLLQRLDRHVAFHAQDLGPGSELGDRNQIFVRVVADFLQQRCKHQLRTGSEQERVAVRCRARHLRCAGHTAGAAAVLDHERLTEFR
jgi:hypothetical protein